MDPKCLECMYNCANALTNQGEYNEAIIYYLRTVAIDPQHDPAFYNLGYVYNMVNLHH